MEVVIIVNIIAVFFAFLESRKLFSKGLFMSFLIIFIFLAIRKDYGNDYIMYSDFYKLLSQNYVKFSNLKDYDDHFEIGWRYLNKIFSTIGFSFNSFLIVLSFANCFIFYKFIKKYVPQNYYWLAIFIYVFNPDFMLIHLSAIRQLLAILIIIYAIPLVYEKKYIKFIILVLFSTLFHTSALFALFLVLISLINWKYSVRNTIILSVVYLSLFVVSAAVSDFMNSVVGLYFDRYSVYSEGEGKVKTGLGFFVIFILIIFLLTSKKNMSKDEQLLNNMTIFSLLMSVIGINLMMVYRLNMYYTPISIVTLPLMVHYTKDFFQKRLLILVLVFFYLYSFYNFFQSEIYGEFYEKYYTIFN